MLERRSSNEVLFEIFGSFPSMYWVFPFKAGGFYSAFKDKYLAKYKKK